MDDESFANPKLLVFLQSPDQLDLDRIGIYLSDKNLCHTIFVGDRSFEGETKLDLAVLGLRFDQGSVVSTFAVASILRLMTRTV